jgi:DNA-binding transcriptional LysR family regulator
VIEHNLGKLRVFYETAREGNFLRAAKSLKLTQPAITKTIKSLEEQLRSPLFVRHSRGVTLTKNGVMLLEFCESLFLKTRDLDQKMAAKDAMSGVVRIGTYETLGELFWPDALMRLKKEFPHILVELTTEHPESHWIKLESGALDLIVDSEPRTSEMLFSRVLYTDHFGIYCRPRSPLIDLKERVPISFVKRATDRRGRRVEEHIDSLFHLRYAVESFTMVRALVLNDLCVGVMPARLGEPLVKNGTLVPHPRFKAQFGEHRICATCPSDFKNDARISRVISTLKRCVG